MTATTLVSYTKAYSLLMGDAISNACVTNSLGPLETKTIQKTHSAVNSLGECCYARVDVGYIIIAETLTKLNKQLLSKSSV